MTTKEYVVLSLAFMAMVLGDCVMTIGWYFYIVDPEMIIWDNWYMIVPASTVIGAAGTYKFFHFLWTGK